MFVGVSRERSTGYGVACNSGGISPMEMVFLDHHLEGSPFHIGTLLITAAKKIFRGHFQLAMGPY